MGLTWWRMPPIREGGFGPECDRQVGQPLAWLQPRSGNDAQFGAELRVNDLGSPSRFSHWLALAALSPRECGIMDLSRYDEMKALCNRVHAAVDVSGLPQLN